MHDLTEKEIVLSKLARLSKICNRIIRSKLKCGVCTTSSVDFIIITTEDVLCLHACLQNIDLKSLTFKIRDMSLFVSWLHFPHKRQQILQRVAVIVKIW